MCESVRKHGPGLSPLARGTQLRDVAAGRAVRFIPAGAGNSNWKNCPLNNVSVYPRWRGELQATPSTQSTRGGLSPLARGTRMRALNHLHSIRFIPAGAGNSLTCRIRIAAVPVYPRWRGELVPRCLFCHAAAGLSPLARGTRK